VVMAWTCTHRGDLGVRRIRLAQHLAGYGSLSAVLEGEKVPSAGPSEVGEY